MNTRELYAKAVPVLFLEAERGAVTLFYRGVNLEGEPLYEMVTQVGKNKVVSPIMTRQEVLEKLAGVKKEG